MGLQTYFVTFRSSTTTLSGPVTAMNKFQAIDAARKAWGVSGDGSWSADVLEQRRAA